MNIENIEATISAHKQALTLLRASEASLSLPQLVFKKYIEIEHTAKVAAYLRESKRKLPNGNSIQPSHVSDYLDKPPADVPIGVVNIGQSIFRKNQKLACRISG